MDALSCCGCGEALTPLQSMQKKKSRGSKKSSGTSTGGGKSSGGLKGVLVAVGGLIAAAAVVFGIVSGISALSSENKLKHAVEKTNKAFVQQLREQESADGLVALLKHVSDKSKFSISVSADMTDSSVDVLLDYSLPQQRLFSDINYNDGTTQAWVQISGKKDALQMRFPHISQDAYGFSLKEVKKSGNKSAILELLGANFLDKLPDSMFSKKNNALDLEKTWDQIWKIAEVESRDKQNGYKVYVVTWSKAKLSKLSKEAANNWLLKTAVTALEKTGAGITCYVKNGCVTKAEIVVAGDMYTAQLLGPKDNLWSSFSVTSAMHPEWVCNGGVESNSSELRIYVNVGDTEVFSLSHNEITGEILISGVDEVKGYLSADKTQANLLLEFADGESVNVELSRLSDKPEQLTKEYIDLLHLSVSDVAKFAIQAASKGDTVQQTIQAISGLLQ